MKEDRIAAVLKEQGLRDTQPRRLVVDALRKINRPASPQEIQKWVSSRGNAVNGVTVYRIIAMLEKLRLVHRHPCSGDLTLCSMPDVRGHHGFLHCSLCGEVQEFADADLCAAENTVAAKAGFLPHQHISEIIGICGGCQSNTFTRAS
jgi:Fe2+ or Zn2+ uptake regulation protein